MDKPLDYSFNEIEIGLEHHFEICINPILISSKEYSSALFIYNDSIIC